MKTAGSRRRAERKRGREGLLAALGAAVLVVAASASPAGDRIEAFGPPVAAETPDADYGNLTLSGDEPPQSVAGDAEIVVVTSYEASRSAGARVVAKIDRPGKKVVLVLASFSRVVWRIDASPDTLVAAVIVSSKARESRVEVHGSADTRGYRLDIGCAWNGSDGNLSGFRRSLRERFGVDRTYAVRCEYTLPPTITVNKPDSPAGP